MNWATQAQHAAESRLAEVAEAYDRFEEGDCSNDVTETVGLWCGGCDTCVVREVLDAALPIVIAAIRAGELQV